MTKIDPRKQQNENDLRPAFAAAETETAGKRLEGGWKTALKLGATALGLALSLSLGGCVYSETTYYDDGGYTEDAFVVSPNTYYMRDGQYFFMVSSGGGYRYVPTYEPVREVDVIINPLPRDAMFFFPPAPWYRHHYHDLPRYERERGFYADSPYGHRFAEHMGHRGPGSFAPPGHPGGNPGFHQPPQQQPGFHPQQPQPGFHPPQQQPGFHPQQPQFNGNGQQPGFRPQQPQFNGNGQQPGFRPQQPQFNGNGQQPGFRPQQPHFNGNGQQPGFHPPQPHFNGGGQQPGFRPPQPQFNGGANPGGGAPRPSFQPQPRPQGGGGGQPPRAPQPPQRHDDNRGQNRGPQGGPQGSPGGHGPGGGPR